MTADGAWPIDTDSTLARVLRAAERAAADGDRTGIDRHYPEAVRLAGPIGLAAVIAARHVDALRRTGDGAAALDRSAAYRARFPSSVRLVLLEAESRIGLGDPSRLDADLAVAAALPGPREPRDEACRVRLEGLAARSRREYRLARDLLSEAMDRYRDLDDDTAVAVVEDDLRGLAGHSVPIAEPHPVSGPRTTAATLTHAEALRLGGRYEEALNELDDLARGPLDPALVFVVTEARVRLLRILHRHDDADALMAGLRAAAEDSAAPQRDRAAVERLERHPGAPMPTVAADRRLAQVRALVEAGRLDEAEELLLSERTPPEPDTWHEAEWHLAAGELTLEHARAGDPSAPDEAVAHLERAAELARSVPLPPVVVAAQRRLGQAHELRGNLPEAVRAWASAHTEEERIAGLQLTDETRIAFLAGVPDEFDEQVRAAAAAVARDRRQVAAVAVAIEAARGAALLGRVLPQGMATGRALPEPGDVRAARAWMRRIRRNLPYRQILWLVHATTEAVHHVLVGRTRMRHVCQDVDRTRLTAQITAVRRCYEAGGPELYRRRREFAVRMDDVAHTLGMDRVLAQIPGSVRRIAVVAGAELSDLPFGALPCPSVTGEGRSLLGRRYALSDLPCLSVRQPLRARSRGQRGLRGLLVQPHPRGGTDTGVDSGEVLGLAAATVLDDHTVITGPQASPGGLADALESGFHTLRIDSHGTFGVDGDSSALFLWPADTERGGPGELRAERLESMRLDGTGTVMLGACDSGMQTRRGRDERTGFVRSALLGGAAAVLAARWDAEDATAAVLLDAFEAGLRHHPRDVALQRAVLACTRAGSPTVGWAGWTLYGDPGPQTAAGPLRRGLARRTAGTAQPTGGEQR